MTANIILIYFHEFINSVEIYNRSRRSLKCKNEDAAFRSIFLIHAAVGKLHVSVFFVVVLFKFYIYHESAP